MKMRNMLLGGAVSASIALAGCATTSGTSGITTTDVQNAAVLACAFLPTAASVASIIAGSSQNNQAGVQTAATIAAAICAAVATPTQSGRLRATTAPTVNGVVVHGKFVN